MSRTRYSTFWPRVGALSIDVLILLPVYLLAEWSYKRTSIIVLSILIYTVSAFAYVAYSILLHGRYGQTVGKMATAVRVVRADSEELISYRQAVLRDSPLLLFVLIDVVLAIPRIIAGQDPFESDPSSLAGRITLYAVTLWDSAEIVTMLLNKKRRAVHDFIADTVVVRT